MLEIHAALFERSNAPLQFLSQRVNNGLSKQQFRHVGSFFFCAYGTWNPPWRDPKKRPEVLQGQASPKNNARHSSATGIVDSYAVRDYLIAAATLS